MSVSKEEKKDTNFRLFTEDNLQCHWCKRLCKTVEILDPEINGITRYLHWNIYETHQILPFVTVILTEKKRRDTQVLIILL